MKHITTICLLMLVASTAGAQQLLTWEDAVSEALRNNHGIAVARNSSAIAENSAHIGNAGMLPRLDASAGATYRGDEPATGGETITGTAMTAGLSLGYTLFDGLGNISTFHRLQSSSFLGKLELKNSIENTLLSVSDAYFAVARAKENLVISEELVTISLERLERAEKRFEYGQAVTVDVLSAQVDLRADSVTLLNARLTFDKARRDLNVLLNQDGEAAYEVEERVPVPGEYELNGLLETAQESNTAYRMYLTNLDIAGHDLDIATSAFLPRLNLSASYGYQQNNSDLSMAFDNSLTNYSVGLTLSLNIFQGFQNSISRQNATLRVRSGELLAEEALLTLQASIRNAWQQYVNSNYIYAVEQRSLQAAELNFEKTKEQLALGQVTTTQFREAQLNLINIRSSISSARYDVRYQELMLQRLAGVLVQE